MSINALLNGSRGRMGQAIAAAAAEAGVTLCASLDADDAVADHIDACDVIIDFSSHRATEALLELALAHKKPIVIGTTGHSVEEKTRLLGLAQQVPCVWAGNFSIGVNLLFALTRRASAILGSDYDIEVVEMHHRLKKDAPSGTAKSLAEILADVRKQQLSKVARHGREGIVGERTSEEIGVHSIRGGDVVGDHTVIFANNGERVELTHKASSRDTFANGALRAAAWVVKQKPGVYDMQDVLGLR